MLAFQQDCSTEADRYTGFYSSIHEQKVVCATFGMCVQTLSSSSRRYAYTWSLGGWALTQRGHIYVGLYKHFAESVRPVRSQHSYWWETESSWCMLAVGSIQIM